MLRALFLAGKFLVALALFALQTLAARLVAAPRPFGTCDSVRISERPELLELLGADVGAGTLGRDLLGFGHLPPLLELAAEVGDDFGMVPGDIREVEGIVDVVEEAS